MSRTAHGAELPLAFPTPFVTYYDVATGERTELSGHAMANWIAKTAGLLIDELDLEQGETVRIAVGTHWTEFIWIVATWAAGGVLTDAPGADVAFVGPDLAATEERRVATALHPMGLRFSEPPDGFIDYGAEVWSHPDAFVGPVVAPGDPAAVLGGVDCTHADIVAVAPESRRMLVTDGSLRRDVELVVATALGAGSLVVVRGGGVADLERIATQEHAEIV